MEKLTMKIVEFRDARDWENFHTPKNLALSLIIETGELFEIMQWKDDNQLFVELDKIKPKLKDELADVAIYLFLLAHEFNIDLELAIAEKIEKNWEKYPVGKKTEFEQ
ncbi:MAG: nucleotide pyrophosphohydrolase [Candidatus Heimdallarchaeota archaeon]|nr:nucleotide pyrophosphohydrolase [Candidatus Heimdallarchaeota archaeon]